METNSYLLTLNPSGDPFLHFVSNNIHIHWHWKTSSHKSQSYISWHEYHPMQTVKLFSQYNSIIVLGWFDSGWFLNFELFFYLFELLFFFTIILRRLSDFSGFLKSSFYRNSDTIHKSIANLTHPYGGKEYSNISCIKQKYSTNSHNT